MSRKSKESKDPPRQSRWKKLEEHSSDDVRKSISSRLQSLKSRVDGVADRMDANRIPLAFIPQGIETHLDNLDRLVHKQLEQRMECVLVELKSHK